MRLLYTLSFALLFWTLGAAASAQGVLNPPAPLTTASSSFLPIVVTGVSGTTFAAGNTVRLSLNQNSIAGSFVMIDLIVTSPTQLSFNVPCGVPTGTYFIIVQGGGTWMGNPWPDPVTNGAQLTITTATPNCLANVLTCSSPTYTQNFNTLTPITNGVCPGNFGDMGAGNMNFTNGVSLTGWHVGNNGVQRFYSFDGTCELASVYNYGNPGNPERSLGTQAASSSKPQFAVNFRNNSSAAITQLAISFVREHWKRGTGTSDRTIFEYSLDAGTLSSGVWIAVPQLDMVANTSAAAGPLNGNLPANQVLVSHTITGLNIPAGSTFWLRWDDPNDQGNDDGMAIDDFSLTATFSGGSAIGTVSGGNTVCAGSPSGNLTLGGSGGTVVRWESAPTVAFTPITTISNVTATLAPGTLPATRCYRAIVNTGACAEAQSNIVCATVNPCTNSSVNTVNPTSMNLCNLSTVTITGLSTTFLAATKVFLSTNATTLVGTLQAINLNATSNTQMTFQINPATPAGTYHLFVENGGTQTVPVSAFPVSIPFTLVSSGFVAGSIAPATRTVCVSNNTGNLTLSGFTGPILRWESSSDNFVAPANITTIANATATNAYLNLAIDTWYRAVIGDLVCEVKTAAVKITMDPCTNASINVVNPATLPLCTLAPVSITGLATTFLGATKVFLSTNATTLTGTIEATNLNATSDTQMSFEIGPATPAGTYYLFVENGGTQTTPAPSAFPVSIQFDLTGAAYVSGNIAPGAVTVCAGINTGNLVLSGFTGPILRWESSDDNFATPANINTITNATVTETYTDVAADTWYRAVVGDAVCEAITPSAKVEIDPSSVGGSVFTDQLICGTSASGSLLLIGTTGTIVRWEASVDSFVTNIQPIINTANIFDYTNVTSTIQYRAVTQSGVCTATSDFVTITVQLPPIAGEVVADTLVCMGNNSGQMALIGYTGDIVRWEYSTDEFVNDINTIANTDSLHNFIDLPNVTQFRAVVASGGVCFENSDFATVFMDPTGVAGQVGPDVTICGQNASARLDLSGLRGPVVRWEYTTDNFRTKEVVFTTVRSYPVRNIFRSYCYRAVVQVDPTCDETVTNPGCVTLIRTNGGGSLLPNRRVCKGDTIGEVITLTNNPGPIVQWESYNDCITYSDPVIIPNTLPTYTVTRLDTTTCFRVLIEDPNCPEPTYSSPVEMTVSDIKLKPALFQPVGCLTNGRIIPNGTGGSSPILLYTLTPAVVPISFMNSINNVPAGTYRLTATDALAGCRVDSMVTVPFSDEEPSIDVIQNITENSATLDFSGPPSGPQPRYNLRFRIKGDSTWSFVFNIPFQTRDLTGLQNNTEYEIAIQYRCTNGNTSDWVSDTSFATLPEGDCATAPYARPGGIYAGNIKPNTLTLRWNTVSGAKGYVVSLGLASLPPNSWPTYLVCDPMDSLVIKGLVPGRVYRYRVQSHCANCTTSGGRDRSQWSDIQSVVTPIARFGAPEVLNTNDAQTLDVYPNPARDRVSLRFSGTSTVSTAEVQIMDLTGRKVFATHLFVDSSGEQTFALPQDIASGIYLLRIRTDVSTHTTRLIVE